MGMAGRRPDQAFHPGQEMRAGKTRWEVVHAPGHTIDHCCFHFPDLGLVMAADIDLTPFGPWYGHRECDLDQFRASIAKVKALKPRILVSSHMQPWDHGIDQALDAYAAVLDRRTQSVLDLVRARPRTLNDFLDLALIYGNHDLFPELFRYFEGQMIVKHLDELEQKGLVRQGPRGYETV
jgi:glyoxylase-like metal-dependent hydrolase (beta-lactamase superfamily II)